jgi:hypothetical protein
MVGKIQSDQDHADLLTYHVTVIRQEMAKVEKAKGPLDEVKAEVSDAQEVLTKAFNTAKGDLGRGYSRKYLEGLIADGRLRTTELADLEVQRARDKGVLNQPVYGMQPELFPGPETPAATKDDMAWEAEGYARGLRGDLKELQDGDPPAMHQALMRGFREGQRVTGERFVRAQALRKAAETPDAGAKIVNLNKTEPTEKQKAAAIKASEKLARESLGAPAPGPKGPELKPAKGGKTTVVHADPVH